MANFGGKASLCLFNVQSEIDLELKRQFAEHYSQEHEDVKSLGRNKFNFNSLAEMPLQPKDEDFYMFPFRHISKTHVGRNSYKSTDFTKGNVLKDSLKLLEGVTAYLNHQMFVGNEVGYVGDLTWRNSYTNKNGDKVPAGIEGPFVIDGVLFPELVRKMSSPRSPIHSASVTVYFEWEPSHDFENEWDFYYHIGEDIDGSEVRRMVTGINGYDESSLVYMGADPYAKMLEDGQVINIDQVGAFSKEDALERENIQSNKKYYVFDCLDKQKLIHLKQSSLNLSRNNETHNKMNKELLNFLASILGTTVEALEKGQFTKEQAEAMGSFVKKEELDKLKAEAGKVKTLESEKTQLEADKSALETEKVTLETEKANLDKEVVELKKFATDENKVFVKVGESVLSSTREAALSAYNTFTKGKVDDDIKKELEEEKDIIKLNKKIELFGGKAVVQYGAHCTKCESDENIVFRSSISNSKDSDDEKHEVPHMATALRK